VPPKFILFIYLFSATSQFDWHITKKNETIEAPQHRRLHFEIQSSSPLAHHIHRWKDDNICQSIWDKSEVLWRTFWEPIGNLKGTYWEPGKLKTPSPPFKLKRNFKWWRTQGTLSACLGLPIGCMKFLFPKEFITIFGLSSHPLQRTPYLFIHLGYLFSVSY